MAKYLEFRHKAEPQAEALRDKVAAAPFEYGAPLLKVYQLLETAEKHGILDLLRGAISAEATIIDKVAGYANTPEGINTMRNLLVLGKLLGRLDPDLLGEGAKDLTGSIIEESTRRRAGLLASVRRLLSGDALRGLSIAVAALESVGRTARKRSEKLEEK